MKKSTFALFLGLLSPLSSDHSKVVINPIEHSKKSLLDTLEIKEFEDQTFVYDQLQVLLLDLKNTPFDPQKRMVQGRLGDLLGYSQAEEIMKTSNSSPGSLKFSAQQKYDLEQDTLNVPLIYPELLDYFPQDLERLLQNPAFEKYTGISNPHLLVVSQCENGKNALGYYQEGKLTLASYVSIGANESRTIHGKYPLTHDAIFRRSSKYNNEPMPYSFNINKGYFLHQGRSHGEPLSKGCIRVPGLYQKWLYEQLPNPKNNPDLSSAEIILEGLYHPTLSKLHPEIAEKNSIII